MVVPERHDEHHAGREGGAHLGEPSLGVELVGVTECLLLRVAEGGGDAVTGDAGNVGGRVGDDFAVLHVQALDVAEHAAGLDELGDDGELRLGVDGHAWAVERVVAHAVLFRSLADASFRKDS